MSRPLCETRLPADTDERNAAYLEAANAARLEADLSEPAIFRLRESVNTDERIHVSRRYEGWRRNHPNTPNAA